jgi:hypothetical protein
MVPTTAQKTSKCTLHVSFFRPVRRVPANAHSSHPILDSSTSCMCGVVVVEPVARNIYSWSNYTPLGKVRVVMIGQDPYHGPGQAHGTRIGRLSHRPSDPTGLHDLFSYARTPPLPNRSLLFGPSRCQSATIPKERKSCVSIYPFYQPPPLLPLAFPTLTLPHMTPVTHDTAGTFRSMRKSRPNIKASCPQSTGA